MEIQNDIAIMCSEMQKTITLQTQIFANLLIQEVENKMKYISRKISPYSDHSEPISYEVPKNEIFDLKSDLELSDVEPIVIVNSNDDEIEYKQRNLKGKNKNLKFTCEFCQVTYRTRNTLLNHIRNIHLKIEETAKACNHENDLCKDCDMKFMSEKDFRKLTKQKTTKQNKYKCSLCEFKTSRKDTLLIHMRNYHVLMFQNNVFKCELCGYSCNKNSDMLQHFGKFHPSTQFTI